MLRAGWLGTGLPAVLGSIGYFIGGPAPAALVTAAGIVIAAHRCRVKSGKSARGVRSAMDTRKEEFLAEKIPLGAAQDVIVAQLKRLYEEGDTLRIFILSSDDSISAQRCDADFRAWRRQLLDYIRVSIGSGTVRRIDALPSVYDLSYPGMKSNMTRREKETIVSHLAARLDTLSDLVRSYPSP
jgi:hypothetical protein